MLACLVFNALETAGTIVWATMKQRHVPASMLGRVSSLDWMISIGLLPFSFALTAPVAGALGARTTLDRRRRCSAAHRRCRRSSCPACGISNACTTTERWFSRRRCRPRVPAPEPQRTRT